MWEEMGGDKKGGYRVYVQGVHTGGGFKDERSVRTESDGGRHE